MSSGVPENEQPNESERYRKKTAIPSHLDLTQLEDFIVQLYPRVPQLARVGFCFVRATKLRQFVQVAAGSVAELRALFGSSKFYILPKRDLIPLVSLH